MLVCDILVYHFQSRKKMITRFDVCISIDVLQTTLASTQAAITGRWFALWTLWITLLSICNGIIWKICYPNYFRKHGKNWFELTFDKFKKLRNSCMIAIKNEPNATVPKWNFSIFLKLITIGDWISSLFLDLMKKNERFNALEYIAECLNVW